MLVPQRKPGDNEYRISYDQPAKVTTVVLFAKSEAEARKVFKTYVGKYEIRRIRKLS